MGRGTQAMATKELSEGAAGNVIVIKKLDNRQNTNRRDEADADRGYRWMDTWPLGLGPQNQ